MEKTRDERLFLQWVIHLPWMSQDTFVSYADYKDRVTGANIDRRSVSEIEAELAEIEEKLQRGGDGYGD